MVKGNKKGCNRNKAADELFGKLCNIVFHGRRIVRSFREGRVQVSVEAS